MSHSAPSPSGGSGVAAAPFAFDLVVVGGGVVGTATAYSARRERGWRVLVADAGLVGRGASQYSLGLIFPYGRTPAQLAMTRESEAIYGAWQAAIPRLPLRRARFLGIVGDERLPLVRARAVPGELIPVAGAERQRLLDEQPQLRVPSHCHVLTSERAGYAVADALAETLMHETLAAGDAACWEGCAIRSIAPVAGGYASTTADGRCIRSARVVVAVGPWLGDALSGGAASAWGVRTKKVAALQIRAMPPADAAVAYFFDEDAFLLPVRERGEWMFSFTSRQWDCRPIHGQLQVRADEREAAVAILDKYAPSLAAACTGSRVFCDAYMPDWTPVVRHVDAGWVVAGGCSGAGVRLAPSIARRALACLAEPAAPGNEDRASVATASILQEPS